MKTTITVVTDDLDGTEDAMECTFGLDGTEYEIDLNEANYKKLRATLDPYIDAGAIVRKDGTTMKQRRQRRGPNDDATSAKQVREWWRAQGTVAGLPFGTYGRVPKRVMDAWHAERR